MKNNTKQTLKIYWQAVLNCKILTFFIGAFIIGASIVGTIIPLYFKEFFNTLVGNNDSDIIIKNLIFILIIIAGLKLLEWILWRSADFLNTYFHSKVVTNLSNKCFIYLHKHSFSFFENSFVGSLVKRIKSFASGFEKIAEEIFWNLFPLITSILIVVIVLFKINLFLGIGIIVWIIIFSIVNSVFAKYKFKYDIQRNEAETKLTSFLADTITNYSNVKLFNGYKKEVKGFASIIETLRRLKNFTWNLNDIFDSIQTF